MRLLLTGAGFSRNWGGWLASEAFEYLLGAPEVDSDLRRLLWDDRVKDRGFEDTLADLQQRAASDASAGRQRDALIAALVGMFNLMDGGFAGVSFEWRNDRAPSVADFLMKFDAIFTLNQDRLLERHYFNHNIPLGSAGRWNGYQFPGLKLNNPSGQGMPIAAVNMENRTADETLFQVAPQLQPYFKLHGSSHYLGEGGRILIMGGNKAAGIQGIPLLKWYHEQFRDHLARATKLMVIGYSFNDVHINDALTAAVASGRLQLFIVDTQGVDVLQREKQAAIKVVDSLIEQLGPHIAGASRRTLAESFSRDQVELGKLLRFLSP